MYLLIVVLNKQEYLEDLLSALVELGITDATIVDSQAMGRALAREVPIFAGLRLTSGGRPYSKTILASVDDKDIADKIVRMLKDIDIDLLAPGAASLITIKVESLLGTPSESDLE